MRRSKFFVLSLLASASLAFSFEGQARSTRVSQVVAMNSSQAKNNREFREDDEVKPSRKENSRAKVYPWYFRVQQAPLLGLAAVSETGVLDVEVMKAVNEFFWIGPTLVLHSDKANGTKMRSGNLGVRADFVLPEVGSFGPGLYISTALLFGAYRSQTHIESQGSVYSDPASRGRVTCDLQSEGYHRAGAFVAGKQFNFNDDVHMTLGLGVIKTKVMTARQSGICDDDSIKNSDGRTLPWFDFGIGFKL